MKEVAHEVALAFTNPIRINSALDLPLRLTWKVWKRLMILMKLTHEAVVT